MACEKQRDGCLRLLIAYLPCQNPIAYYFSAFLKGKTIRGLLTNNRLDGDGC